MKEPLRLKRVGFGNELGRALILREKDFFVLEEERVGLRLTVRVVDTVGVKRWNRFQRHLRFCFPQLHFGTLWIWTIQTFVCFSFGGGIGGLSERKGGEGERRGGVYGCGLDSLVVFHCLDSRRHLTFILGAWDLYLSSTGGRLERKM